MISLHTHTTYSFLDGYGLPHQYSARLQEIGQTAMAITDHGNIYGHRSFAREFESVGIKPIFGCEFYVYHSGSKYAHLTVLAKNNKGYENLCKLVSLSNNEEHFKKRPILYLEEIMYHQEGLIILTGCFGTGILHKLYESKKEEVLAGMKYFKKSFNDVYVEVQHIDREEMDYMRTCAKIAGLKCVASLDAHYPYPEDYEAEDALFCIGMRQKMSNPKRYSLAPNLWLMSEEEALCFGYTQEELDMTDEIGEMCDVKLEVLEPVTVENGREKMIELVREGAKRLGDSVKNKEYRDRYLYEMSIIDKLGLHAYFVIMGQTIVHFKKKGMFIGQARGSSAGSLICYLIGITEIDPLRFELSFERFLDLNRTDYPDIDTDFPHDKRDEVVEYLQETFGRDRVGRICSFMGYRGSSVFWDLCRINGIDSKVAKSVGKSMPAFSNDLVDMEDMFEIPAIAKAAEKWPCLQLAKPLENQIRQLGKHASGYAISPVDLSGIVAYNKAGEEQILSVDKNEAENMGLLKLDILGLNTLDLIEAVMEEVGLTNEDIYRLKYRDQKVFSQFSRGNVSGIFQFEGGAVRRVLKDFEIKSMEDLAFISAVARPGASLTLDKAMIPPEAALKFCYQNRYFVYQEELMAILAWLKFDWAEITKFRKMVSKKKVTVLKDLFKDKFIERMAVHSGIAEAERFWNIILRCGEYMFNKSHAIAYSALSYACMKLKIDYPEVFIKHYLNRTSDDVKRRQMVREWVAKGNKVTIFDKNVSKETFTVEKGHIYGSLLAIKGIGAANAKKIMEGKIGKGAQKAINNASIKPEIYAPWCVLDYFDNKYPIGNLPEGEYLVNARVWEAKDGRCIIEDAHGIEKAYYNERFTKLVNGEKYRLAITKYKYPKIDSAKEM